MLKTPAPAYEHQDYPKWLYPEGAEPFVVESAADERALEKEAAKKAAK